MKFFHRKFTFFIAFFLLAKYNNLMPFAGNIFYREFGRNKKGLPVVLIHGAGGDGSLWTEVGRGLSRHFHLYIPDLPGHGKSKEDESSSIEGYTHKVLKFLKDLNLNRIVLAGHSMGGAIAINISLLHKNLLSGLILISTGAKLRVHPSFINTLKNDFENSSNFLFASVADPLNKDIIERIKKVYFKQRREVVLADFLACDSFDKMEEVKEISIPTLIICGSNDILTPLKYSNYLHEKIKTSSLVVIQDCGHMLMLESPEKIVKEINNFVRGLSL